MLCPICGKEQEKIYEHLSLFHPIDDNIFAHKDTVTSARMIEVILEILAKKEVV